MSEKKYKVIDDMNHVIAENMDLDTALLLIKACCEKYYAEKNTYTVKEMDVTEEKHD